MSTINLLSSVRESGSQASEGILSGIVDRLRRYRAYRKTLTALDELTDRELVDLGLSRDQLESVAHRAAFGD